MPSKTKKERKIKTITDIFTGGDGVISNTEMLQFFEKILFPCMSRIGSYPERLVRVGATHQNLNLSLKVSSGARERGSVYTVNLPEFAQTALTEIDNYRIIHLSDTEGIYKVIEKVSNNLGIYVLAFEREPKFKIEILPTEYMAGPITIKECGGVSTFKYLPNLDDRPRKVTIETCVAERVKGDKEKLVKKLLVDFHKKLGQKYIGLGMTHAEE